MNTDALNRFTRTIDFYHRYRPDYPAAVLSFMEQELGFGPSARVADIGSGTGKLTNLFLKNGNPTIAVEPNEAMRQFAEKVYGSRPHFVSKAGNAASTGLASASIDFITVAQAFHWFEPTSTRTEFRRILKPGGWVLLIWNKRVDEDSAFMQHYNEFLEIHSTDYQQINLRKIDLPQIDSFFDGNEVRRQDFEHAQVFDLEGLIGRYRSCSYAYTTEHPAFAVAIDTLTALFHQYAQQGQIAMSYRTEVYYGRLH